MLGIGHPPRSGVAVESERRERAVLKSEMHESPAWVLCYKCSGPLLMTDAADAVMVI